MGILDEGQNALVETGGAVVFLAGVIALGSAGGLVPVGGVSLSPLLSFLAIVVGLYLMGYRKLGARIGRAVERLRT